MGDEDLKHRGSLPRYILSLPATRRKAESVQPLPWGKFWRPQKQNSRPRPAHDVPSGMSKTSSWALGSWTRGFRACHNRSDAATSVTIWSVEGACGVMRGTVAGKSPILQTPQTPESGDGGLHVSRLIPRRTGGVVDFG